ncbi:barstar family protein [Kitasatospora sp. NPDC048540]|uniref:barstar family protein n=1 Tax=Kitasatospora sp. NPDC048540 TaxID=3155634 RepID=UPI0034020971
MLGPGRYFGREWNAFRDCLCGGFGVTPPFTLTWHDSDVAHRAPADVVEDPEGRLSYFEEIVQLLERRGVTLCSGSRPTGTRATTTRPPRRGRSRAGRSGGRRAAR